jgi:hypothetical protein
MVEVWKDYVHMLKLDVLKSQSSFQICKHSYIVILKKDICNKRTKKNLFAIHHYLFILFNFEGNIL